MREALLKVRRALLSSVQYLLYKEAAAVKAEQRGESTFQTVIASRVTHQTATQFCTKCRLSSMEKQSLQFSISAFISAMPTSNSTFFKQYVFVRYAVCTAELLSISISTISCIKYRIRFPVMDADTVTTSTTGSSCTDCHIQADMATTKNFQEHVSYLATKLVPDENHPSYTKITEIRSSAKKKNVLRNKSLFML